MTTLISPAVCNERIGSKTTVPMSTPPSLLDVGTPTGFDWELRRRKGNTVRYQNINTGTWDNKFTLEPGDVLYRELDTSEPAPETAAERLSDDMGQSYPDADVEYAYESMTRDQLRQIAADRKIKGRGSMSKAELVVALREG